MQPTDLQFDLGAVGGSERLVQTAWAFAPEDPSSIRGVLVCMAGGTYDKHYWHLEVPGHGGYSFAEHLAGAGWLVVAVDHLGVGNSSDPMEGEVGLERLRDGDIEVVRQIRGAVVDGTLVPGVPALAEVPVIGVGHSMGACLTAMVQAKAQPYDGVVLLGYGVEIAHVRDDVHVGGTTDLVTRLDDSEAAFRTMTGAGTARFHVVPRIGLRSLFHAPDVPGAVMDADDQLESRVPVRAASEVTTAGFVRDHAAIIHVPVLLGFGSVLDVSPDPHREPAWYPASSDVTLFLLPGSAHCHNMAARRTVLWDRIATWCATVVGMAEPVGPLHIPPSRRTQVDHDRLRTPAWRRRHES